MSNRFSLEHLRSFSIEGPDARAFAQSQFTVDVDSLAGDRWSPLAWCDPKGRVLAVMMGLASENGVDLVLPAGQADELRERLQRFTIGRRVELTESAPVAGEFEPRPPTPALMIDDDCDNNRDDNRGLLAGTRAGNDAEALMRWRKLDLCRGLPWLAPASSGQHLPQWLGLEELGALAYDKGCYPGQEVIARLHYRGSVKYRLCGLRLNAVAAFDAHTRLTDEQGAGVGHWLGGVEDDNGSIGLAVLSTRIGEGDTVLLQDGDRTRPAQVTTCKGLC